MAHHSIFMLPQIPRLIKGSAGMTNIRACFHKCHKRQICAEEAMSVCSFRFQSFDHSTQSDSVQQPRTITVLFAWNVCATYCGDKFIRVICPERGHATEQFPSSKAFRSSLKNTVRSSHMRGCRICTAVCGWNAESCRWDIARKWRGEWNLETCRALFLFQRKIYFLRLC